MHRELHAGLKKISFLSELEYGVLDALVEKAKISKFVKQTTIIVEGDDTSSLYFILSGKVKVFGTDVKHKQVTLMIQEAGSYFGEIALLSDEPRSASVVALEPTVCAVISKADFISWLMIYPEVAVSLLGVMSEKIRQLTVRVKQLALSNVYERTIQTLQSLSVSEGGVSIIYNRPTQQDLATMVGASREMINKIMHELIKGEYVKVEARALIINKKFPSNW